MPGAPRQDLTQKPASQAAALKSAFAEFEQASAHLADVYASLERRVAELTAALHDSRAALESELSEKERLATRLSVLLEALPGGVVVLDAQGHVAESNPAARELLGEMTHQAWIDIVARAFAPRWDDGHDVSLADGRRVNVATAAFPNEPGQILLIKDVSETRHLQEQLNHHRRLSAKTELAAVLAHQIRTPLATALLAVSGLARGARSDSHDYQSKQRALDAIRRIEGLVNDMLSFARGSVVDPELLELPTLFAQLARAAESLVSPGFTLQISPPVSTRRLFGNVRVLVSLLLNLLENARQASDAPLHCRVSARANDDRIVIAIDDDGPGIPANLHQRIFEPFFTTRAQGTGLGLAAARAVARAHGGELRLVEARAPGAHFELELPTADTRQLAVTVHHREEKVA